MYYYFHHYLQNLVYLTYLPPQIPQNAQNIQNIQNSNQLELKQQNQEEQALLVPRESHHLNIKIENVPTPQLNSIFPGIEMKNEFDDEQYQPDQVPLKKERKNKQDQNRNVIPNTIHQILSFIQKKQKSLDLVKKVFQKYEHDPNWTISRFYNYQKKLKDNINHYVNENSLSILNEFLDKECYVYSQEEQTYYIKVARIIANHFLQNNSNTSILTSKRMDRRKRFAHLEARRLLLNKLKSIWQKN